MESSFRSFEGQDKDKPWVPQSVDGCIKKVESKVDPLPREGRRSEKVVGGVLKVIELAANNKLGTIAKEPMRMCDLLSKNQNE